MNDIFYSILSWIADVAPQLGSILKQFFQRLGGLVSYAFSVLKENDISAGSIYTGMIRWFMPILALVILGSVLRNMLSVKNPKETWGYLSSPDLGKFPISHWECTVGRARHCDVIVKFATISRTQCALIRNDKGQWRVHNLADKNITKINGMELTMDMPLEHGDTLSFGGIDMKFESISKMEYADNLKERSHRTLRLPSWSTFIYITLFQFLTAIQLMISKPEIRKEILMAFGLLMAVMWIYVFITKASGKTGFEPEILAFFACTLNLAVTATALSDAMLKQSIAICLGFALFIFIGVYMRNLNRVVRTRYFMAAAAIGLFLINVIFSKVSHGARNWISIGGISLQPSEIAKICFIFAGAATLDRLFEKKNLFGFMALSGFCMLALAITSDFGTAAIFFVTFLVIAFLRSGDFATLALISGGAVGAIALVLRFKPYVANRFSAWGHVWEHASDLGYQQVRTMSAASSGGLIGTGAGTGWLHNVAASETDLVFGVLCEEWGLIIAFLAVMSIFTLCVFTFRVVQNGRSSYYTIAACAASSLMVFQTMLNVFGSVDILPLTGVTFPFISCGGSSMLASWGLLAFIKAADTRQNASFAVRKNARLGDAPDIPDVLAEEMENLNRSSKNKNRRSSRRLRAAERTAEHKAQNKMQDASQVMPQAARVRDESQNRRRISAEQAARVRDESQNHRRISAEQAAQQEIDDFFSQFDELDELSDFDADSFGDSNRVGSYSSSDFGIDDFGDSNRADSYSSSDFDIDDFGDSNRADSYSSSDFDADSFGDINRRRRGGRRR